MRKLTAAVFGFGMIVAASAYADHISGNYASGHEVRTPQSVNEAAPARGEARGRSSESVYHPDHGPKSVSDIDPTGSRVGTTRSDRVGTARSESYTLFGMRFNDPGLPRSVDDATPSRPGR